MTPRYLLAIALAMLLASQVAVAEPAASAGSQDAPLPAASDAAAQPVMASG